MSKYGANIPRLSHSNLMPLISKSYEFSEKRKVLGGKPVTAYKDRQL
jgi:hypothetical protein